MKFIQSASGFRKLTKQEINNLTLKEARQIANYSRRLINQRLKIIQEKGYYLAAALLNKTSYKFPFSIEIFQERLNQKENLKYYQDIIKTNQQNLEYLSIPKARENEEGLIQKYTIKKDADYENLVDEIKNLKYNPLEDKLTLKQLKKFFLNSITENTVNSDSELQDFVDEEYSGDWSIAWETETITIDKIKEYEELYDIIKDNL